MTHYYSDATDAIRDGNYMAPMVVAYRKPLGWFLYEATDPPSECEPEILCIGPGRLPIALTEDGLDVLRSVIRAGLDTLDPKRTSSPELVALGH